MTITKLFRYLRDSHIIRVIIVTITNKAQKMKDPADKSTKELTGISETVTKKRGRPATGKARTPAQRKSDQRANVRTKIVAPESDGGKSSESWTLQECLYVLADANLRDSYGKEAHERLGVLLGIK